MAHPSEESLFSGKRVVITGGAGSIGGEIVAQLLKLPVEIIRIIDNNETSLFHMEETWRSSGRVQTFLCDIRDEHELARTFSGMHYCFHAAALKHVPLCEHSPFSAVQTNVIGTQNVIRAALRNELTRAVLTSTDKAVNPTNVMGTSKLMAERLFTAANVLSEGKNHCIFGSVRFGNVAGTRGSVIPLFCEQIRVRRLVTLTDPKMTRFMMTLEDAGRLVVQTLPLVRGGEIFITKMVVVTINDLAQALIELIAPVHGHNPADIEIKRIGVRPGEKLWEELNTDEEVRRTYDLGQYLVVIPALKNLYGNVDYTYQAEKMTLIDRIYHSSNEAPIDRAEIKAFLKRPGVLPSDILQGLGAT